MPAAKKPAADVDALWLAVQYLLPVAYPHGQWAHVPVMIEKANLPTEVADVLNEAYRRATA